MPVAYILKICVRYGNVNMLAVHCVFSLQLNDAALLNNQPEDCAKHYRALAAADGEAVAALAGWVAKLVLREELTYPGDWSFEKDTRVF